MGLTWFKGGSCQSVLGVSGDSQLNGSRPCGVASSNANAVFGWVNGKALVPRYAPPGEAEHAYRPVFPSALAVSMEEVKQEARLREFKSQLCHQTSALKTGKLFNVSVLLLSQL